MEDQSTKIGKAVMESATCAICKNEMGLDDDYCPTCGAASDRVEESEGSQQEIEHAWGIVRTYSTNVEAEIVAGRLRYEGIPAIVLSQVDSTRNLTVGALAIAKVFVREHEMEKAEQILAHPGSDPDQFFEVNDSDG